jgi:excisionase family DNA binding protein
MNDTKRRGTRRTRPIGHPINFDELPDWVPPAQAALYLNSGVTTIYALCHRGVLPYKRFGRLFRVPKEALRPEVTTSFKGLVSA